MDIFIQPIQDGDYLYTITLSCIVLISSFFGSFYILGKFIHYRGNSAMEGVGAGIGMAYALTRLFESTIFSLISLFFALLVIGAPAISYIYVVVTIIYTLMFICFMVSCYGYLHNNN